MPLTVVVNRVFNEIALGDRASLSRLIRPEDVEQFSVISGAVGSTDSQGVLAAELIAAVLGTWLPGPGTIYRRQDLRFLAPIRPLDTITVTVTVSGRDATTKWLVLDCVCVNQDGVPVIAGTVTVQAPAVKVSQAAADPPEVRLMRHARFRQLLAKAAGLAPAPTAIAHPCDAASLRAASTAAAAGLITPILVGPENKIRATAAEAGLDIGAFRIEAAAHSHASAARAVALVRNGEARLLMKGSLHTDELLHEVMRADTGLRTGRRLSHVYVLDVPEYARPLLQTDAVVNIAPTLEDKVHIVQNAIDLAHVLGVERPRVEAEREFTIGVPVYSKCCTF